MRTREAISILGGLAALAALPVTVGCTLLVGAQLSDKPAYGTGGGGAGGSDGAGGQPTAATTTGASSATGESSHASSGTSAGESSSSSSGGPTCPMWFADCDGMGASACKTNLRMDPMNCGACMVKCMMPGLCINGKCK